MPVTLVKLHSWLLREFCFQVHAFTVDVPQLSRVIDTWGVFYETKVRYMFWVGVTSQEMNGYTIRHTMRSRDFYIAVWWRHQMETFSALLALCEGNPAVTGGFPSQRSVTRSFDVFFLICTWTTGWANNRDTGDLRRHCAHYHVTAMYRNPCRSETQRLNEWLGCALFLC